MSRRRLEEHEITTQMDGLAWAREGDEIVKSVTLADFAGSMAWVNRVAELSEQLDHHPDIAISWNQVTLRLTTHSAGGLTALDFELARAVDTIQCG